MKSRLALLSFLSFFLFISCVKSDADPYLKLSTYRIDFDSFGDSISVDVVTNRPWEITTANDWVKIGKSKKIGSYIHRVPVVIVNYKDFTMRKGEISVSTAVETKVIKVYQGPVIPVLYLETKSFSFPKESGSFSVELVANDCIWTINGAPSWITLNPQNGRGSKTVAISYQLNPDGIERKATLAFTSGAVSESLVITQGASERVIDLDIAEKDVYSGLGTFQINVNTNNAPWEASGMPDWITLSENSAVKGKTVTVTYQVNNAKLGRSCSLVFKSGNDTKTLKINQDKAPVYSADGFTGDPVFVGSSWWAPVNLGYDPVNFKYGKLYQWGRKDGQGYGGTESAPEIKIAPNPTILPLNPNTFYTSEIHPFDWHFPRNDNLWGPVKTANDPCPEGWRLPKKEEIQHLISSINFIVKTETARHGESECPGVYINGHGGKRLFFPLAGYREYWGETWLRGTMGLYWSGEIEANRLDGIVIPNLSIFSNFLSISNSFRATARSIRCVKE